MVSKMGWLDRLLSSELPVSYFRIKGIHIMWRSTPVFYQTEKEINYVTLLVPKTTNDISLV